MGPVLALAGFGVYSLRTDRAAVEKEAERRAEDIVKEVANRLKEKPFVPVVSSKELRQIDWRTHERKNGWLQTVEQDPLWQWHKIQPAIRACVISAARELVYPPPLKVAEDFSIRLLNREQASTWDMARSYEFLTNRPAEALVAYRTFLGLNPPRRFEEAARVSEAVLLRQQGEIDQATTAFRSIAETSTESSETGIPFSQLAAWQLATSGIAQENLRSEAILNPSLFSPTLLLAGGDSSQSKEWHDLWGLHEQAREVPLNYLGLGREVFWLSEEGGWIGLVLPLGTNGDRVVLARNAREAAEQVSTLLRGISGIPDYLSISVEFCGKEVFGDAAVVAVLATARGESNVAVRAGLKDRAALYAESSRRAWVFGSLIVASAISTIWAFVANCQALARQHRLNEIKTNFVSSVSHELRAPIASVRLMAESLAKGRVTGEKQGEYFKFITHECRRLGTLIENVLDISRIEQSRRAYELAPANVGALVSETVENMKLVALEKGVKLEFLAPKSAERQEFELDAGAMQQAVINLIDNAIKHAPAGSMVRVTVGMEGGGLSIAVQDEGEGIPAREQEKIFERFYRSGSELRRKTPGVGIGLSIVKHIVEGHQGRVELESAPGNGSCFRIVIPDQQT